jgi:hypothetical protein
MSAKSSFVFKISLTATTVTLAMSAPIAVGVSAADATSNLCQQVTTAEVSAALGDTRPQRQRHGVLVSSWLQP